MTTTETTNRRQGTVYHDGDRVSVEIKGHGTFITTKLGLILITESYANQPDARLRYEIGHELWEAPCRIKNRRNLLLILADAHLPPEEVGRRVWGDIFDAIARAARAQHACAEVDAVTWTATGRGDEPGDEIAEIPGYRATIRTVDDRTYWFADPTGSYHDGCHGIPVQGFETSRCQARVAARQALRRLVIRDAENLRRYGA